MSKKFVTSGQNYGGVSHWKDSAVAFSGQVWRDPYSDMLYRAAEKAEKLAKAGKLEKFKLR